MATLEDGASVGDAEEVSPAPDVPVTAHQCSPDRTVFVEEDNSDGWIASSVTVDVTQ
jgi:hypothetical protein